MVGGRGLDSCVSGSGQVLVCCERDNDITVCIICEGRGGER